jgi:hypothetical protein
MDNLRCICATLYTRQCILLLHGLVTKHIVGQYMGVAPELLSMFEACTFPNTVQYYQNIHGL